MRTFNIEKEFLNKSNCGTGIIYNNGLFETEVDISNLENLVNSLNDALKTVYKVKGSTTVSGINSMTVSNAIVGCVYNLTDSGTITNGIGGELVVDQGDNVVYTENGWDKLSAAVKMTLEAGDNISIEDNVISAKGYIYDKYNKSIIVGNEYNIATGYLSFAQGDGTRAIGEKSHAEGGQTVALGKLAHAEGSNTMAIGKFSHTEGEGTLTNNESEHALGTYNISNTGTDTDDRTTLYSIGIGTESENKNAHEVMNNGDTFIIGIGDYNGTNPYEAQTLQLVITDLENVEPVTYSIGDNINISEDNTISALGYTYNAEKNSFSVGDGTATGQNSYAEGDGESEQLTEYSWEFNSQSIVFTSYQSLKIGSILKIENNGENLFVKVTAISDDKRTFTVDTSISLECNENSNLYSVKGIAYGEYSHSEGQNTIASGNYSHAEGQGTNASGERSHAEGYGSQALGKNSHAEGQNTIASGLDSHAEGVVSTASGKRSHAEGDSTTASGENSHAEGSWTKASGKCSHAEGDSTEAKLDFSHAEGYYTKAEGQASHAEGNRTKAEGIYSHAEGSYTKTNMHNECEHAQGKYNVSHNKSYKFGDEGNTIHSIGIGTSEETRKNAQEVMQNGDYYIIGIGDYDGTTITKAQTLQEVINSKVDKEEGKGLSTEDYTTEEKTKLEGIEEGALVNIQSDWNLSDETLKDYIKNKPDLTIYLLKEEGKSLTSNDYTTEEKEKLSGIEEGAQVNAVNSVNGQTGDVVIEQLTAGNNINIENNVITAKGYSTDTTNYTFASGYDTNAIGVYTHAEGFGTKAQGSAAHAEGCKTVTTNAYEHAQGSYNLSNTGENQSDKTLHSIGIGNGEDGRKNAHEVMLNGDTYIIGIGGYTGTNPTEAKTLLEVITEILSKLS